MNKNNSSAIALNENITTVITDTKESKHLMPAVKNAYNEYVGEHIQATKEATGEVISKEQFTENLTRGLKSKNGIIRQRAEKAMSTMITDLAFLVLKQNIASDFATSVEASFNANFTGEALNEGNSIQYQVSLTTGHSVFNINEYYPGKLSVPQIEQFTANMYDPTTHELSKWSFQFKKSLSITRAVWMPYYISGKLDQLIAEYAASMKKTFDVYLYDKNLRVITDPETINYKVEGKAANMFDAFSSEILPLVHQLKLNTNKFNLSATSKVISSTAPQDIIILMNSVTATKFKTGIQSQLPTANFINVESFGQIFEAGFIYNVPADNGENTIITVDQANEYIDPETVIILDKNSIKNHMQVQYAGEQEYATNMVVEKTNHIWGNAIALPWGKAILYHNANLQVMPSTYMKVNEIETETETEEANNGILKSKK